MAVNKNSSSVVDPATRFAVHDVLGRYVWALDTGDIEAVMATFTKDDCRFIDSRGNLHDGPAALRTMFGQLTGDPDFRGRQHIITHLFAEMDGDEVHLMSYWTVVKWTYATGHKQVFSTGSSHDRLVRNGDRWLIRERAIEWFTDQHGPWVGA